MGAKRAAPLTADDSDSPSIRPAKQPKTKGKTSKKAESAQPNPKSPEFIDGSDSAGTIAVEQPTVKTTAKTMKADSKPAKESNTTKKVAATKSESTKEAEMENTKAADPKSAKEKNTTKTVATKSKPTVGTSAPVELLKKNKKLEKRKEELEKQCKDLKKTQKDMEKAKNVEVKRKQELQKEVDLLRKIIEENNLQDRLPSEAKTKTKKVPAAKKEETKALYHSLIQNASNPRPKGRSIIDYAVAHATLLPKIKTLATMQGGIPMAFEVLVTIMFNFRGADPDAPSKIVFTRGEEALEALDETMCQLAKLRWADTKEKESWGPKLRGLFEMVEAERDFMERVAKVDFFFDDAVGFLEEIADEFEGEEDEDEDDEEGEGDDSEEDGEDEDEDGEGEDSESEEDVDEETMAGS